jgi:hypothetical protein
VGRQNPFKKSAAINSSLVLSSLLVLIEHAIMSRGLLVMITASTAEAQGGAGQAPRR